MEKPIHHHVKDIMEAGGVKGIICADKHGLCLESMGEVVEKQAGLIVGVAAMAKALEPDNTTPPIICIEDENGMTLIKTSGDVTTAIFK